MFTQLHQWCSIFGANNLYGYKILISLVINDRRHKNKLEQNASGHRERFNKWCSLEKTCEVVQETVIDGEECPA